MRVFIRRNNSKIHDAPSKEVILSCLYVLSDVKDVFDLFDFWDGRDGMVDGAKIGDVMRCIGLNPTVKCILENGGSKKLGLSRHHRRHHHHHHRISFG